MSEELSFYYAGPKFAMLRNVVYRGGIPSQVNGLIEKIPALAELFIPINPDEPRVAKARLDVKIPGTKLHALAQAVRAWLKEEQKKRAEGPGVKWTRDEQTRQRALANIPQPE